MGKTALGCRAEIRARGPALPQANALPSNAGSYRSYSTEQLRFFAELRIRILLGQWIRIQEGHIRPQNRGKFRNVIRFSSEELGASPVK
jgi:hypothetical protein